MFNARSLNILAKLGYTRKKEEGRRDKGRKEERKGGREKEKK